MADIYYFCGHEQFQPEILVKHAVLAEEAGFDGIAVSEHFNPWVEDVGAAGYAFSTLGAIAQATSKVKLMTAVVTPLFRYHPAAVAQAAATLDRLSNGRFILGVGTGEALNEVPLGYNFPGYVERAARMKEALIIMRDMLNGEISTYEGQFYKTNHAKLYSPPLHSVPIYLAAGGPKSAALAIEQADGIITSVKDLKDTQEKIISQTHDKIPVTATRWTVYGTSENSMNHALKPWRGLRAPHRDTITDPAKLQKEADTLDPQEILSKFTKVTTSEDYIKAYAPLITEIHAQQIVIQTTGESQEEVISLLGKDVVPTLKGL